MAQKGVCPLNNTVFLVLSLLGFLFVFISTIRYGSGLTPDSANYISLARNLLLGKGYLIFNGEPMTVAPPLFPTVLAIIGLAGVDPLIGARFLNAVVFGLIIFVSGQLFSLCVRSRVWVLLGTVSVLFSLPLLNVSAMVWTEPLFILLSISAIFYLFRFLDKRRWPDLFLLSIATALCCIQRYIGVSYLFAGLGIIFFASAIPFKQRLKYIIIFCLISLLPLLVWVARDYVLTNTLFGIRYFLPYSLVYNVNRAFDAFTVWFLPGGTYFLIKGAVVISILFLAIAGFLVRFKRRENTGNRLDPVIFAGVYLLFYVLFLLVLVPKFSFGKEERSLSPIFVPFILLVLAGLEGFLDILAGFKISKNTVNWVVTCLLIFGLIISFTRCVNLSFKMARNGSGGYNTKLWRESGLISWIKTNSLNGFIFSNEPEAVYLLTGKLGDFSPRKYAYDAPNCQCDNLAEFTQAVKRKPVVYLIWFKNSNRVYLYNIEELRSKFTLKEIVGFADGAIYSLNNF